MEYDIIIIGTGAGGGAITQKLAQTNKKILILERGNDTSVAKENSDEETVFVEQQHKTKGLYTNFLNNEFQPDMGLAGRNVFYDASLLRLRKKDFEALHHYGGISPAWPISYADLKPYYDEAETRYHVHGERGLDPTDPESHFKYPHQPFPHGPRIQALCDDIKCLGLHPFPLPVGVKQTKVIGETPVILDRFDGISNTTKSNTNPHVIGIETKAKQNNVTLMTNVMVTRLLTNSKGNEINAVEVIIEDEIYLFRSSLVIMADGAINSAALLLKSRSSMHPNGLANSSDLVGRNYMCHNKSAFMALSKRPSTTRFGKTFAINDFYFSGGDDFDFPMGHIQMLGKPDSFLSESEIPKFTANHTLEKISNYRLDFCLTSEDLPNSENRVVVNRDDKIQLQYKANNTEGHKRLTNKLAYILKNVNCETYVLPNLRYIKEQLHLTSTAHQCGTLRFGKDPKTSVLDTYCKTHDIANLYVVDGSFFPSSSAVNPALTIMAQALRVGDYLIENKI